MKLKDMAIEYTERSMSIKNHFPKGKYEAVFSNNEDSPYDPGKESKWITANLDNYIGFWIL